MHRRDDDWPNNRLLLRLWRLELLLLAPLLSPHSSLARARKGGVVGPPILANPRWLRLLHRGASWVQALDGDSDEMRFKVKVLVESIGRARTFQKTGIRSKAAKQQRKKKQSCG